MRIGLIGAGWVARQHLEAMRQTEGIRPVGITSRTRAKADELAGEFVIGVVADDLDSMLETAKPDALMVLVSAENVFEVAKDVISRGLPVFIEKPAGLSVEANEELAALAAEHGVTSMVGFNRRYYSVMRKGLDIVREHGRLLGVVVEGHERFWRVKEGPYADETKANWIYANGVHTIDLLRFFGGEPKRVSSVSSCLHEAGGDQFAAVMELECGALGTYYANWYSPGGWRAVLYGEGVTVEFKPLEKATWTGTDFVVHEIECDECDTMVKPGFVGQIEAFARLVSRGEEPWPAQDLSAAARTMRLARAIAAGEPEAPL